MPLKTHIDGEPALNLTAMLDVMFLLVIFFMLGTRFIDDERKIGLRVPEVSRSSAAAGGRRPQGNQRLSRRRDHPGQHPGEPRRADRAIGRSAAAEAATWACSSAATRKGPSNTSPPC